MSGIFISYRRIDTIGWAGRLFADLSKQFGSSKVFMDINGGITRGADFKKVLTEALSTCDVLLALLGPQWLTCTRNDGRRRLDVPDDWVRNEIATALHRKIWVVPVLLGQTKLPEDAELPDDLRPLRDRQSAEITDTRWDYDMMQLIKDIAKIVPLDDVASANNAINILKDLITKVPAVADAVGRSKEVIENTYCQIDKLELFKTLHDALHTIEFECLRPMQEGGAATRLRPFKIKFTSEARRIQDSVRAHNMNPALRDDILDQLELTTAAFQAAVDTPGDVSFAEVAGELNVLLSGLPPRLDIGIAAAAAELNLDRLVELMHTVRNKITPRDSDNDTELGPFVNGINALERLRDELKRQVNEHTRLQGLESKLRTVCVGGTRLAALANEWSRIKLVRSRIVPPFSIPLQTAIHDLAEIEAEIGAVVGKGEVQPAMDLLQEYFRAVGIVFRDVDTGLKDFCWRLSDVSKPLQIVLSMS
jgi:TIR domain